MQTTGGDDGPDDGPGRRPPAGVPGRRIVLVVVVLAALVVVVVVVVRLLHPPVIGEEYSGAGPGTLGIDGSGDTTPTVGWVEPGSRFFVMAYGSSTCPIAPVGIDQHGTTVEVDMRRQGGSVCTADSGPATYAVDLPDRVHPQSVVRVTLSFEDGSSVRARLGG